jgi:hypothetical protein
MQLPLAVSIGDSLQGAFDAFFEFVPNLIAFVVILVIGYFVAKIVAAIARKVLEKLGLDKALHESDAGQYVERVMPDASPSSGIGRVVFWLIFVFFFVAAVGALQIPAVTTFMNQVLAYLPNVIAAIVIFVAAAAIAGAVAGGVAKLMGDTPTGKVVATAVPAAVMTIAFFMILEQLQIAPEIVRIAFAATMFSLGLGLALAFGLGGRSVAERMLEDAYRKGREQKQQVKEDVEKARARGEERVEEGKEKVGADQPEPPPGGPAPAGPSGAYRQP